MAFDELDAEIAAVRVWRDAEQHFAFLAFDLLGNVGGKDVVHLHAIRVEPLEFVEEFLQ